MHYFFYVTSIFFLNIAMSLAGLLLKHVNNSLEDEIGQSKYCDNILEYVHPDFSTDQGYSDEPA